MFTINLPVDIAVGQEIPSWATTVVIVANDAAPYRMWRELCAIDPRSWMGKRVILHTGIERMPDHSEEWEAIQEMVQMLGAKNAVVTVMGVGGHPWADRINHGLEGLARGCGACFEARE